MASKPQTPYRRKGEYQSRRRPCGAFISGAWHCDCDPPLPAEHFKTKKAGPNQGRWFYTCQTKKCGFFLWDDDAKPREEAAVLGNSRNEPNDRHEQDDRYSSSTLRNTTSSRGSLPSPPPSNLTKASKRKLDYDDEDVFYGLSPTGEDDQRLAAAVDAASSPTKARDDLFTTPKRRKLPWMEGNNPVASAEPKQTLLTPSKQLPSTPSVRSSEQSSRQQVPDTTPTPTRFRDVDISKTGLDQLEEEVMQIFQERKVRLDQATAQAIHQSFTNYDRKVQGFVQGRDMLRLTVKAKEAKITELQHCIATMEAEREIDRAIIQANRHGEHS